MTREVPGERWRQVAARVVRRPLFPWDVLDGPSRAAPGVDGLPLLREADRRDRAHPVVLPLDVPGYDARIERRIVHGEEHLRDLIDRVAVAVVGALRDGLGEESPVARRQL